MRRISLLSVCLVGLSVGCGDVVPQNPYDPETPVVGQAPAKVIGVVVLREDGASVARVAVGLKDAKGEALRGADGQVLRATVEGTGARGAFTLAGVPPGDYSIVFDIDPKFAVPFVPEFSLQPGDTRDLGELVFTVQQTGVGRIRGRAALVEAAGGARSISVYRRRDGRPPELMKRVTTDADGTFDADQLPPGTYAIAAEATGFFPDFSAGHVLAGEESNGLVNEVVLEGDDELRLYPATAVLVPDLPRKGSAYFTNADTVDLLVIPTVVDAWVTEMRLSADRAFRDGDGEVPFEAFRQRAGVPLPDTEGPLPLYGQFRAKAGEFEFTTDVFQAEIVRDVTPPQFVATTLRGLPTASDGLAWLRTDGATVTVELQANDVSSAIAAYAVYADPANSTGTAQSVTFRDVSVPPGFVRLDHTTQLLPGQGPRVLGLWLKDNAGNIAGPTKVEVVVDSEPPTLQDALTVTNANQQRELDSRFAVLRIPVDSGCSETPVKLAAGTCPVDFRYGTAPLPSVGLFAPFELNEGTVVVPVAGGNGQSVGFEVQLRDAAGNVATYQSELYTLKLLGQLSGRALVEGYPDDSPAHGNVVVSLYEPGGDRTVAVARGTSTADGRFVLRTATDDPENASTRLPAGHYLVVATRGDLEPFEAETDVRENELSVLPAYRLTPARGTIRGKFVRGDQAASPRAHANIEVTASRAGIVVARTVTAEDGTFSFPSPGIPVTVGGDRYTLLASASGYAARRLEGLEVVRDETTVVESDGATPPEPRAVELTRLAGDFVFCESLSGDCLPTPYTNRENVRIRLLEATGVSQIRFQARNAFAADAASPAWVPFNAATPYVLPVATATDADGPVPVFVQTRVAGTLGPVLSASVLVDRVAPSITSFELLPGTDALPGFTNRPTVRVVVNAEPGTGEVSPLQTALVGFTTTPPTAPMPGALACAFGTPCNAALPTVSSVITEGLHTAWAFACDRAGNCSTTPSSVKVVYDVTPPRQSNGLAFSPAASWITRVDGTWYSRAGRIDVALDVGTARTAANAPVLRPDGTPLPDVVAYRFGLRMDVTDGTWRTLSDTLLPAARVNTQALELTGDDGRYDLYAQFRDAAGNVTEVEANPRTFAIVLDRLPPAVAMTVNGGAEWANNRDVALDVLTAAGDTGPAREVLLSLDGGLFETFVRRALPLTGANARFQLPDADGPYVLYGRFTDAAGNVSDRLARVYLDRAAPRVVSLRCGTCREDPTTGTVYTNAASRQAVLDLVVSDNSGAVASVSLQVGTNPVSSAAYVGTVTATLPDADGPHLLKVRATDPAGNVSVERTLTVVLDRAPPNVTFKLDDDRAFATTASVVAGITNNDGSALSGLRLSNSAAFSGPVQAFASRVPWTLSTPTDDGARTVYAEVTDPAGNVTTASDTITLDTHAPTPPTLAITAPVPVGTANAVTSAAVTLRVTSTDGSRAIDTASVLVEGDLALTGGSTGWLAAGAGGLTFSGGNFAWAGNLSTGDGTKQLTVRVRDAAGNASDASILRVLLRTAAPTGQSASISPTPFASTPAASLLLAASGATSMRIAGDVASVLGVPGNVNAWIPFAGTAAVALTSTDGAKAAQVTFRNEANQETATVTASTTLDTAIPTATVELRGLVADGVQSTSLTGRPSITLGVTGTDATSGVDQMRVATTALDLANQPWTAYATALPWTLAGADGTKSLFVQLRDRAGLVSTAATASILLDTLPPSAPDLTVTSPATLGTGNALATTAVTIGISSTDAAGSLLTGRVKVEGDIAFTAGAATTGWLAVGSGGLAQDGAKFAWSGQLSSGDGPKAVTVVVRDAAGQESAASTLRFNLAANAPAGPAATLTPAPNSSTTAVTLALSAVGATQVRIAGDLSAVNAAPANVNAWLPMATSANATLTTGDGVKAITVTYRNNAGIETTPLALSTRLDTTAPTGTLAISGTAAGVPSAAVTSTTAVTLTLGATDAGSGVTDMRLGHSLAELAAASWRTFAPSVPWSLAAGDATKTVMVQFRDAAGLASSASVPVSASIVLDTTPPTTPVLTVTSPASLGAGNALTTRDVAFTIASTDVAGALSSGRVRVDGDIDVSGASSTGWLAAGAGGLTFGSGNFAWTGKLSTGDGAKDVTVRVRDAAGNESDVATIRFNLQTAPPSNVSAQLSASGYTGTAALTLTSSATGATQVKVSGDLASVNGAAPNVNAWITYTASLPIVLSTGDGLKTVNVSFRNAAGLESATAQPIALTIRLDTTQPTGTLSIVGAIDGGATSTTRTGTRSVTLALTSSDAGSGPAVLRVADTPVALASASWVPVATSMPWTLTAGDGSKDVYLQVRDAVGNVSGTVQASTTLDLTPPSAPRFAATAAAQASTTLAVSLGTASTDVLSSPVRYEWLTPALDRWTTVTFPTNYTLAANVASSFRLRAVDGAGNVSAEDTLSVIHDDTPPVAPTIVTPSLFVAGTTTSGTLTRSDADANFARYELCVSNRGVSQVCPASPCVFATTTASFALSLNENRKNCVLARGIDLAGNSSPITTLEIISDTQRPVAPGIGPAVTRDLLTVRAPSVEVGLQLPAYDPPAGTSAASTPWVGVAYLEFGSAGSFTPLCPTTRLNGQWAPCDPTATGGRCTDPRLVCRGTSPSGVVLPVGSGVATTLAARAVDLAGNVGDVSTIELQTAATAPLTSLMGEERYPKLFGTTLAFVWETLSSGVVGMLTELGPNRAVDASDVSCNVDDTAPGSYYTYQMALGRPGAAFTTNSANGIRLRRRGADGKFCTGDDGASTVMNATDGVSELTIGGETLGWLNSTTYNAERCYPVKLREPGTNDLLDAVGDSVVQFTDLYGQQRFSTSPALQLSENVMIVNRGGCPAADPSGSSIGDWVLVHRKQVATYGSYFLNSPVRWAFTASRAVIAPDGTFLVTSNSGQITVRQPGVDALYGTADDRVITRDNPSYMQVNDLTTDGLRIVASGNVDGINRLLSWSPGADAVYQAIGDPDDDDGFALYAPSSDGRSGLTLSSGLVAYTVRGNLGAVDLSQMRWETADRGEVKTPTSSSGGLLMEYIPATTSGGLMVKKGADERRIDFGAGFSFSNSNTSVLYAAGDEAVYSLYDSSVSSLRLYGRRRASGQPFFTGTDTTKLYFTAPSGEYVYPMAIGDGKALLFAGPWSSFTPYVIEPGAGNLANGTLVNVRGGSPAVGWLDNAGISRKYAVWWNGGPVYVRDAGANQLFEAGDTTTTLKIIPNGLTDYYVDSIAHAGDRIALVDSAWSYIRVVSAGKDTLFSTADDTFVDVPVDRPGVCRFECYLRMAGNYMGWIGTETSTGTDQVYVHDLRTRTTLKITDHQSTKTDLNITSTGRAYWSDGVFPYRVAFSFAP